ncbi:MAG: hypothetical protein WCA44_15790 [Acidobacteriaceae bacterium]
MDGYWLAHYDSGSRHGEGMVILRGGDLLGGDLEHIWTGTYEDESPKLYARIRIVPFVSCAEERSMAREQPVIVNLSGFCTEEFATLEGCPEGRDAESFHVDMRKCRSIRTEASTQRAA